MKKGRKRGEGQRNGGEEKRRKRGIKVGKLPIELKKSSLRYDFTFDVTC